MSQTMDVTSKERVLIVDDEKSMRFTLASILEYEGYEVDVAADGEEAVSLCRDKGYGVVLMDVRMPGIDGVEAFRRISRHQESVRVIMMSGYSIDDLKEAAFDEGAIAFLAKPVDLDQLIKLIAEVNDTAILIVENDAAIAIDLEDKLIDQGYRVTLTCSPHEALELAEQIMFDLIFIDAELPAMNGLELYLAIKKLTPSSVAIMISGRESEFLEIAKEAVRRTAYTVVHKPLDMDHVLSLLQRVTQQRAADHIVKPDIE